MFGTYIYISNKPSKPKIKVYRDKDGSIKIKY